jgi:hypothetical protein
METILETLKTNEFWYLLIFMLIFASILTYIEALVKHYSKPKNEGFVFKRIHTVPISEYYLHNGVPFKDIDHANETIDLNKRYIGLTVNIDNKEYWYAGGIRNGYK